MFDIVFPDNKLEYIPAGITLLIFTIFAWRTVVFFQRQHKKELKKIAAFEQQINADWIVKRGKE